MVMKAKRTSSRLKLVGQSAETDIPKHRAIADLLLQEIEAGRWGPGERIPSEEQLVAETGASLGTIQRALRNLVELGIVVRRHGLGTFVVGGRAPFRHLRHFRFLAEDGVRLLPVFVKVIDVTIIQDTGPWSDFLGEPHEGYVRIKRKVDVGGEFDLYSEVYLPADRFGALAELSFEELDGCSIRDCLAERFNAPTLKTHQTMLCQPLPLRAARVIGVPHGTYGFVWVICAASYRDAPITWQRVFIPPNDNQLELLSGNDLPSPGRQSSNRLRKE